MKIGALALVLLLSAIGWRLHASGARFGDVVALWVLAVTLLVEALVLLGGFALYRSDPDRQRLAQMRAELELLKQDKRNRRRTQIGGL